MLTKVANFIIGVRKKTDVADSFQALYFDLVGTSFVQCKYPEWCSTPQKKTWNPNQKSVLETKCEIGIFIVNSTWILKDKINGLIQKNSGGTKIDHHVCYVIIYVFRKNALQEFNTNESISQLYEYKKEQRKYRKENNIIDFMYPLITSELNLRINNTWLF
ncbi:hypothetical protein BpHYR1_031485 [Brachionus plicatilis]|uniref:Uncharacterized protein n=1 Tax=Brachionus plicatilis TaxID=10195 RepID=A0A3M7SPX4_BRAPC|nr:hypothetical protein BpHYR1_031485 [Brachionus plicatilis]